jgi:DNA-binding CsgD family transcriptional regulator
MIAALYDGVFGIPFAGFQRFALDQVGTLVEFDSALWINGVDHADQVHNCLLINQPDDLIARYLADYATIDLIRHHAVRAPGRAFRIEDVAPMDQFHRHPAYLELWQPAGIEQAIAIAALDPISMLMELVVLWRADPASPFSPADVAAVETLVPHALAAWRHRQLAHLREQAAPPGHPGAAIRGNAVCDANGTIYASDAHFNTTMQAHFPAWQGPELPASIRDMIRSGIGLHKAGSLDLAITPGNPRSLLTISSNAATPLTAAERRVAALYAEGLTHAQIAGRLGISTSTVRNQIAAAYRKLEIHSKAELARRIPPAEN